MDKDKKMGKYNGNHVQIFCRLRSLKTQQAGGSNVRIKDSNTVVFPSDLKQNGDYETHYVFKQVFDERSNQAVVFDVVARPLVESLLCGENILLFTYGVHGSGKTYTMAGTSNECGIVPRCLKTLFHAIDGYQARKGALQTNCFKIRAGIARKIQQSAVMRRKLSEIEFNLESIEPVIPVRGINKHHIYAVYVSYVEIYNNSVYDLLENDSQKALQSHIVREDSYGNMYIHGATEFEVFSVQEAIEALRIGEKRKRMGQIAVNEKCSRSHSIFNIRLVQGPSKKYSQTDYKCTTISQLSLVDLAGSARSSRTKNTGAELRETGKINNSLMKLRQCLEYLRESQLAIGGNGNGHVTKKILYRDSKLTYLFKNYFEGEGQVSMIVCINPIKDDYAENSQVLRIADMTREVRIIHMKSNTYRSALECAAWNMVNPDTSPKKFNEYSQFSVFDYLFPNNLNFELDLSRKTIIFLERPNLSHHDELTKLYEVHQTFTEKELCNDITQEKKANITTARKPLSECQIINSLDSTVTTTLDKQNLNIEGPLHK